MNCKGIATLAVMGAIFVACIAGAYLAEHYLPHSVAVLVDDDLEEVAEHEVEDTMHRPEGSLKKEMDVVFPKNS